MYYLRFDSTIRRNFNHFASVATITKADLYVDTLEFIQIRKFIVKLGKMLHKYGTPAFRLEAYLTEVATYLGVRSAFISTPTSLTFVLWSDRHEDEYNSAARLQPGELDLNALSRTDELAIALLSGELSLSEADKKLDEIDAMPSPYGKLVTFCAFGLATSAFAMLMGASVSEIAWSGILGLLTYIWCLWATRSKRVNLMLEPVTAFVSGLATSAIGSYLDPGTPSSCCMSRPRLWRSTDRVHFVGLLQASSPSDP